MKKLKILYLASVKHKFVEFPDEHIKKSLEEMGHEVIEMDENEFDMNKILSYKEKVDLLFFHRGGVIKTEESFFQMSLTRLELVLQNFTCPKVCWYLDKVISYSGEYLRRIFPLVDYIYVNDDTWLRAFETDKISPLHCGIHSSRKGEFKKELASDLAYVGVVYGTRKVFIEELQKRYGKRFKAFDNIWGKDFDNLMASAKIIVSAHYPFDEFYWSDSIYRILGSGGFHIYPRLEGIIEEGFESGKHLITYTNPQELVDAIAYWLDPKNDKVRKKIAKQGQDFVSDRFNYKDKLRIIINKIKKYENKGIK